MAETPGPGWIRTAMPALAGVAVAAACVAGYLELAEDLALSPRIAAFDEVLGGIIRSWRTPVLTGVMRAVTWSGDTLTVTALVTATVGMLLWRCREREALLTALVVASGIGLGTLAKRATERARPPAANALVELPTSFAFPSGHSLAAVLLWTMVAFAVLRVVQGRWMRVLAAVGGGALTVLVGTSRVYLGVHWPSDVLASWLLGSAWLAVTLGAFLTWERWSGR